MRLISLAAAAMFVAAAGLAFAQVDPATSQPTPPAATETSSEAPAPAAGETPAQTAQQPQSADQRVTCRTITSTESRLRRNRQRMCGTRAQWEQMQDENARQLQNTGSVQGKTGR